MKLYEWCVIAREILNDNAFFILRGIMQALLEKISEKIKRTPSDTRAYEDLYYMCRETLKTNESLGVTYLKILSNRIEREIMNLDGEDLKFIFGLHRRVLLTAAPFDFESYLLYVEWERDTSKKFYVPRRKMLKPIVQAMQDTIDDKIDLLTISMPPGTGKSTLGIFFLLWVMGKFPDGQNLASAHSFVLRWSFTNNYRQRISMVRCLPPTLLLRLLIPKRKL